MAEGGGLGLESGDGFDEVGDGEGGAAAARAADQAEHTAFAGELDGDAHQRGNAGAVNLRNPVQDDDNSLRASLNNGLESIVELLGWLADGEPAVNVENRYSAGFADVDFHGEAIRHVHLPGSHLRSGQPRRFLVREALYDGGLRNKKRLPKRRSSGNPAQEVNG